MRTQSRPKVLFGNLSIAMAIVAAAATPALLMIRPRFGTTAISNILAEYILWVALASMMCGGCGLLQRGGRIIALCGLSLAVLELVGVPSLLMYF